MLNVLCVLAFHLQQQYFGGLKTQTFENSFQHASFLKKQKKVCNTTFKNALPCKNGKTCGISLLLPLLLTVLINSTLNDFALLLFKPSSLHRPHLSSWPFQNVINMVGYTALELLPSYSLSASTWFSRYQQKITHKWKLLIMFEWSVLNIQKIRD